MMLGLQDYSKEPMTAIPINNPDLVDCLDQWLWFMDMAKQDRIPRAGKTLGHRTHQELMEEADRYTSHEYLDTIKQMKERHDGYPEFVAGYPLDFSGEAGNSVDHFLRNEADEQFSREYKQRFDKARSDLISSVGVKRNALAHIYPPGGYISWHNNANAAAYNVLFTWSENGDGYWEHVDPRTDEVVHIADQPGWNCKVGYYGRYSEWPSRLVYHAARTNCWRMTVAFTLTTKEASVPMWNMLVEDIMQA